MQVEIHVGFIPLFFNIAAMTMNWNKGGPGAKRGFGFGGFSLAAGKKEEPPLPEPAHNSFGASGSAGGYGKNQQLPAFYKIGTKRANFDEENAWVSWKSGVCTWKIHSFEVMLTF